MFNIWFPLSAGIHQYISVSIFIYFILAIDRASKSIWNDKEKSNGGRRMESPMARYEMDEGTDFRQWETFMCKCRASSNQAEEYLPVK